MQIWPVLFLLLCDQLFQQLKGFLQLGVGFIRVQPVPDAAADMCP